VACGNGSPEDGSGATTTNDSNVPAAEACTFEQSIPVVFASGLQLVTESGTGTEFYVGGDGFLTAVHVVRGESDIAISRASGAGIEGGTATRCTTSG
jgi:hypothetical protein